MDNFDSLIFDGLLDRYIEEQAKFEKGQVVYMEYTYQYHNQTSVICVLVEAGTVYNTANEVVK